MDIMIDSALGEALIQQFFDDTAYNEQFDENDLPDATWADDGEDGSGDMEQKDLRYVRTPAGERHYHQPIGTPIVAGSDVHPVPNTATPVAGLRRRARNLGESHLALPDRRGKDVTWKETYGNKHISRYENYRMSVYPTLDTNDHAWRWDLIGPAPYEGLATPTLEHGTANSKEEAQVAVVKAAQKRAKEKQKRVKRDYENIMEQWPGTYGYDWVYPDDKIKPDPQKMEDDPEYREEMAIRHSEKMGMQVVLDDGTDIPLDVNAHETVNSILAVHEDMFPGFINLFDSVGSTGNQSVYGYNQVTQTGRPGDENGVGYQPMKTGLRFGVNTFGDTDNAYANVEAGKKQAGDIGWSACKIDRLKEQNPDDEEWRLAMMTTITHETGHTIGRVLFGEMGSYPNGETYDPYFRDKNKQRTEFMTDLQGYFDHYGITTEDLTPENFSDAISRGQHVGGSLRSFDRANIAEMVSQYGSASFHEMLAETWAEYMLDDQPREFVQEVGGLMESLLMDWLDDKKKYENKIKKGK